MLGNYITVDNNGPLLVRTNFWESPVDSQGALFCSVNANAIRLLVPRALEHFIEEMRTGSEVLVTRGDWPAEDRKNALELMWEDGSVAPFAIQLCPEQLDRLIPEENAGQQLTCLVYIRGYAGIPLLAGEWPARFRVANQIPCLRRWAL
jgi:hypothetical protein